MGLLRNRRERAIGERIRRIVAEEIGHFGPDWEDHKPAIEQRVRDRLAREHGETPLWQLILELLIRLLPLLLEDPKADLSGHVNDDASDDESEG